MMSTGQNMFYDELPMSSPEHNSMPTMNTAEMFDTIWCSSDSGVSEDRSPPLTMSPSLDENQDHWNQDDTSILEANLFNCNRSLGFEDDLDIFSFAKELVTEDEQPNFPDNISEISLSSSTITSHSIPSSVGDFSDDMNQSDGTDSFMYSSTLKYGNVRSVNSSSETINKRHKGSYSKKIMKIAQERRKGALENFVDNGIFCNISTGSSSLEALGGSPNQNLYNQNQNSDNPKGLSTLAPSKKNVSCILDSNIKWSELASSDQRCLADGFETIISQTLGLREQLDVNAILKPKKNGDNSQDAHVNTFTLLDDNKLDAVRRYLKSLEDFHSNSKPYHSQKNKKEKKSKKREKTYVKDQSSYLLKSNSVNLKEKAKNITKSNSYQNEKLKENFSRDKLKTEKSQNHKCSPNNPEVKKVNLPKSNPIQAVSSKSPNIDIKMTVSQPSISWQQRKKPSKSKSSNTENPKSNKTSVEDQRLQRTYAEEYQEQRIRPTVLSSKSKETLKGKPSKDYKKKIYTKDWTPSKKSKINQEHHSEFDLLRKRSRKEYRQLMKEKRSGLFLKEQVVSLSTTTANPGPGAAHLKPSSDCDTEDDDVDILG